MGSFGKKQKGVARAMFYDGELQGFMLNIPVMLHIENGILIIERTNPEVQARLPLDRVKLAEAIGENVYLQLYKGTDLQIQKGDIRRCVLRIVYLTQDGLEKTIAFWCTVFGLKEVENLVAQLNPPAPGVYNL